MSHQHRPILMAAVLSVPLLLLAGQASADSCRKGCNLQKRDCIVADARVSMLACKLDCRANATDGVGACSRPCVDTFRASRATCKDQQAACHDLCGSASDDPGVDGQCVSECAHGLGDCTRGGTSDGRACVEACRTDPGPGPEIAACLSNCSHGASDDAQACNAVFKTCVEGCGATVPTTLPEPTTTVTSTTTSTTTTSSTTTSTAP